MKIYLSILIIIAVSGLAYSQNFGINETSPGQKLDVGGWVELGNESTGSTATTGTIRYHSSGKLQFYNGSSWVDAYSGAAPSSTFVHWGVTSCPSGTSLVYTGWAAGSYYQYGSGANMLCLTNSPSWSGASYSDGNQNGSLIYGVEFETSGYGISTLVSYNQYDGGCAVCLVSNTSETMMVPGTTICPSGWTQRYWGYLMSTHYTQTKSEFVCVDHTPTLFGSTANDNGDLWYPTEKENGSLGNPGVYPHDREITCTVCSR